MHSPDDNILQNPSAFDQVSAGMPGLGVQLLHCRRTNKVCCKMLQYRAEHNQMYR